jgi:hypothetical protein
MIYPIDVYAKAKRGGKMSDSDKVKIGLGVLLVVNVVFTIFMNGFFSALGVPLILVIGVQFVLFVLVFVTLFRFFIFREQDRDLDESDVFMQYYKFRPGSRKVNLPIGETDFFELKNNACVCAIQFKFGSNDDVRKVGTETFLKQCVNLLSEKNIEFRFLVVTESFMDTPEFELHLKKINQVVEPRLRSSLLEVYGGTFAFTEQNSSAETIVLLMYAANAFMLGDLEDSVVQIESLFQKMQKKHAFRKREFLDAVGLLEIFRQFYAMGAIDLSLSKIQMNATDPDVLNSIVIYRIISEESKVYRFDVFGKIKTNVRRWN